MTGIGMGFAYSTLPSYLNNLDLSVLQVSSVFLGMNLIGVIAEPFFGYFCDKFNPLYTGFTAALIAVISGSLMGPLPFLNLNPVDGVIITASIAFSKSIFFNRYLYFIEFV